MATLDIIILIVLSVGLFRGYRSGAVRQIANLMGLAAAFISASLLMGPVSGVFVDKLGISPDFSVFLAFIGVFLVVRVVVRGFGASLDESLSRAPLSGLNRVVGGATGVLKSAVVLSLLFLMLGFAELPSQPARVESDLYRPVSGIVPKAWEMIGRESDAFDDFRKQVEQRIGAVRKGKPT
ncbi:MAG: hypothetical protein COV99_04135 [Bacteroidetes bacterium CG12_big_fil_rev_8_21_14_0_65_60_17]|nr:MAG: hypothetical protein COV99_04135 [Bacteroidetes bacterium CG12_big_fil_rev_8_21_14_0_65_60_17]